jgi:hypothetical protein
MHKSITPYLYLHFASPHGMLSTHWESHYTPPVPAIVARTTFFHLSTASRVDSWGPLFCSFMAWYFYNFFSVPTQTLEHGANWMRLEVCGRSVGWETQFPKFGWKWLRSRPSPGYLEPDLSLAPNGTSGLPGHLGHCRETESDGSIGWIPLYYGSSSEWVWLPYSAK